MKKRRMAILGAGNIAEQMARTMQGMRNVQCYAVASRDIKKAERFAKKFGFKKAYGSYEELVKDEKVELIYVATPHSHHYACAMLCLQNHKPVLCEKAFTVNAVQAQELIRVARERNVLLAEAMWTRYMPMVDMIRGILQSGIIGTPTVLTANLGYQIDHVQRLTDPALAGGALLDVGVYTINFASMMFGDNIEKIDASCIYTDTGVDASNSITLHYKDGRMAVLCSTMRGVSDRKGIIYGSKGYAVVENINNFEMVTAYNGDNKKLVQLKRPKQITGFEYQVQACIDALDKGAVECPQMPHAEIIKMMQIMDECRRQWGINYPCEGIQIEVPKAEQTNLAQSIASEKDALVQVVQAEIEKALEEPTENA